MAPAYRKDVLIDCWPDLVLPPTLSPGLYTEVSISRYVGDLILQCYRLSSASTVWQLGVIQHCFLFRTAD